MEDNLLGMFSGDLDSADGVNSPAVGQLLAWNLEAVLSRERLSFPEPVNILALGAGGAAGELVYVEKLGIGRDKVTLVDRYNESKMKELKTNGVGRVINGDMFEFMATTSDDFSLVMGLGIEYVIEANPARFFDLVSRVVKPGGIMHLSAPPEVDESYWQEQSFHRIGEGRLILVKD